MGDRVFPLVAKRHELVIAGAVGELEARHPANGLERGVARPLQALGVGREVPPPRHLVEAADPDVDRVDLAAADQGHQLVAGLLELEPAPDDLRLGLRQLDRALAAEEIRGVQHVDVERVALDPLAAIEQPAEIAERSLDRDPEGVLDRPAGAHLVGDRADAADPGGDVRGLVAGAAAQEGLEETRRLEDPKLGRAHLAVAHGDLERALALDPRQIVDLDRPSRHGVRSPRGTRVPRRCRCARGAGDRARAGRAGRARR